MSSSEDFRLWVLLKFVFLLARWRHTAIASCVRIDIGSLFIAYGACPQPVDYLPQTIEDYNKLLWLGKRPTLYRRRDPDTNSQKSSKCKSPPHAASLWKSNLDRKRAARTGRFALRHSNEQKPGKPLCAFPSSCFTLLPQPLPRRGPHPPLSRPEA